MNNQAEKQLNKPTGGVRIRTLNAILITLVAFAAFMFVQTAQEITSQYSKIQKTNDNYIACEIATSDLMTASTYLTTQSRLFSATHNVGYLYNYLDEVNNKQHREQDVKTIAELYPNSEAADSLQLAYSFSNTLQGRELYSMKLVVEALNLDINEDAQKVLDEVYFKRDDEYLSPEVMLIKARDLITDEAYEHEVSLVTSNVETCQESLAQSFEDTKASDAKTLEGLYLRQQVLTWFLLLVVLAAVLSVTILVLYPLNDYIKRISSNEPLSEQGAKELRILARAYNVIYNDNQHTRKRLLHEAEHDPLTDLFNRGAFDKIIAEEIDEPLALLLVDIDYFKLVNDKYGHDCGDRVLQKTATKLGLAFRTTDYPCRLGGDEFAVIMTNMKTDRRFVITRKMKELSTELGIADENTPAITISVGVAFSDGSIHYDDLYKFADEALYRVKDDGRNGIAYYDEDFETSFSDTEAITVEGADSDAE